MQEIDLKIFNYIKGQLLLDIPLLEGALNLLEPKIHEGADTFATEGLHLYYDENRLRILFKKNPLFLQRLYLHTVLHCLYLHPFNARPAGLILSYKEAKRLFPDHVEAGLPYDMDTARGLTAKLMDLACDIAVEYIIDRLQVKSVQRPLSFIRTNVYNKMEELGTLAPVQIFRWLQTGDRPQGQSGDRPLTNQGDRPQSNQGDRPQTQVGDRPQGQSGDRPHSIEELEREFYTDSHVFWPEDDEEGPQNPSIIQSRRQWEQAGRRADLKKLMNNRDKAHPDDESGSQVAEDILTAGLEGGERQVSYREVLRSILSVNEKSGLSPHEFDLGYYSFGLAHYGSIPLIEPIETYEDSTVKELVIVIDTSYSTSGELVKSFLNETGNILKEEGLWALGGRVRLLQCDECVRNDELIHTDMEFTRESDNFKITGGGGTDFRPPFTYVDELIAKGKAQSPDALLYFTDGLGIYPKESPTYPVAFLFTGNYDKSKVPPWALALRV